MLRDLLLIEECLSSDSCRIEITNGEAIGTVQLNSRLPMWRETKASWLTIVKTLIVKEIENRAEKS